MQNFHLASNPPLLLDSRSPIAPRIGKPRCLCALRAWAGNHRPHSSWMRGNMASLGAVLKSSRVSSRSSCWPDHHSRSLDCSKELRTKASQEGHRLVHNSRLLDDPQPKDFQECRRYYRSVSCLYS